jgi:hypothetical protein
MTDDGRTLLSVVAMPSGMKQDPNGFPSLVLNDDWELA